MPCEHYPLLAVNPEDVVQSPLTPLMNRYVEGDMAAFDALYLQLAPHVRRRLVRLTGPEGVDDLVQLTFMKVHRSRNQWRRNTLVRPWVMTIARHLATDSLRARGARRDRLTVDGLLPELDAPVSDSACLEARASAVHAAIHALPESQRSVVELHKLEGRSFDDIALTLGISSGTARVRAHRAYSRLRTTLNSLLASPPPPCIGCA
ncbi:MAG: RNA polymerase sigma factor (sigma-70 family) [Bradymonadia bacterium]|jgi:RNA polymerase sigma factor (sigma-70 family)